MHRVLRELPGGSTSSATIGLWNAPASTFLWVTAGHQAPYRVTRDGQLEALEGPLLPELGTDGFPDDIEVIRTRIVTGELLLLLSDGVMGPDPSDASLAGLSRAVTRTQGASAPATVRAIEDFVRDAHPDHLDDDATLIVLTPSGMIGPRDGATAAD